MTTTSISQDALNAHGGDMFEDTAQRHIPLMDIAENSII